MLNEMGLYQDNIAELDCWLNSSPMIFTKINYYSGILGEGLALPVAASLLRLNSIT
jgi:hypothetical protein